MIIYFLWCWCGLLFKTAHIIISYLISFKECSSKTAVLCIIISSYQQLLLNCVYCFFFLFYLFKYTNEWLYLSQSCFLSQISHVDIDILSFSLCIFSLPQATDETLMDKLKQQHLDNPFFVPSSDTEPAFVIQHFAGRVTYHIKVGYTIFIFNHICSYLSSSVNVLSIIQLDCCKIVMVCSGLGR